MNLGWQKFMEVSKFSNSVVVTKHSKAEIKWKMGKCKALNLTSETMNQDSFILTCYKLLILKLKKKKVLSLVNRKLIFLSTQINVKQMFRDYQFKNMPNHLAVQVIKCPRHRLTSELWKAKNDLRNIWKENQLLPYDLRSMLSFNSY